MTEQTYNQYQAVLDTYIEARTKLAETERALELAKHSSRVKLYTDKANGVKYTEEQIRSLSNLECQQEDTDYTQAYANFDIARERLEFMKLQLKSNN